MAKFYVVEKGYEIGIYDNWADCQKQILGFKGAIYKSYPTIEAASLAFKLGVVYNVFEKKQNETINIDTLEFSKYKIQNALVTDGACSKNPGAGEFKVVDLDTMEEIYLSKTFPNSTNNIMEFLGLVESIKLAKQLKKLYVYTDSVTAMAWLRDKKCSTKLKDKDMLEEINNAILWLKSNNYSEIGILKWDTKNWGESPADFGRK